MALQYFDQDLITITISYILFWVVIIILILYPKLRIRKTLKRIKKLEKNLK
ncbi:MAG: heme exporter protein CcmD [Candidatus Hermodarchaeota archaeon]